MLPLARCCEHCSTLHGCLLMIEMLQSAGLPGSPKYLRVDMARCPLFPDGAIGIQGVSDRSPFQNGGDVCFGSAALAGKASARAGPRAGPAPVATPHRDSHRGTTWIGPLVAAVCD